MPRPSVSRSSAEDRSRRSDFGSEAPAGIGGRLLPPGETVSRVWPHAAALGVTRLARTTDLDDVDIPVWLAVRPNSASLSVSQGKGLDDDSARASALMEVVELALAEAPDPAAPRASTLPPGERAVDVDQYLLPGREADPEGPWILGRELATGHTGWIPLEAVSLDYTVPWSLRRFWQSTDGLASGNCMAEAIAHGLLERVERDALALWSFRDRETLLRARLADGALLGPEAEELVRAFAQAGHAVTLFDITTDLGVPVIVAAVRDRDADPRRPRHFDLTVGSGCHPDPIRAAVRALTEAAQSRVTVISGARDDFPAENYRAAAPDGALDYGAAAEHGGRGLPIGSETDLPSLIGRISSAAGSVWMVPLADRPEFSVVKMIVPGLESPPGSRKRRWGRRALARMFRKAGGLTP